MNNTIKITIHNVPGFCTWATIRVGRKKISGEDVGFGFETAARRSALYAARDVLTSTQFEELERAYGL